MRDTVNLARKDSVREKSGQHARRLGARPAGRFGARAGAVLPVLLICLLTPAGRGLAQMTHTAAPPAQSDAQKAFERLKTLAGSWQGSVMGIGNVNLTIRVTSSGNAVLHEVTSAARPDDPVTMFYVDGDRLLLTHYCDAGNRPRMEGRMSPDGKTIEFTFVDIAGGTRRGYMSHAIFNIIDADHHTEAWSYVLPDGRQLQTPPVECARKK